MFLGWWLLLIPANSAPSFVRFSFSNGHVALYNSHNISFNFTTEAENERMHLLTFLRLKQPGPLFRAAVLVVQGVFFK